MKSGCVSSWWEIKIRNYLIIKETTNIVFGYTWDQEILHKISGGRVLFSCIFRSLVPKRVLVLFISNPFTATVDVTTTWPGAYVKQRSPSYLHVLRQILHVQLFVCREPTFPVPSCVNVVLVWVGHFFSSSPVVWGGGCRTTYMEWLAIMWPSQRVTW